MKTRVIRMRDAPSGWETNPQYVYIGRGSLWGNPFHIGDPSSEDGIVSNRGQLDRDDVIQLFETQTLPGLLPKVHLLQGKTLVCFCKPQRCHGDSLIAALIATSSI